MMNHKIFPLERFLFCLIFLGFIFGLGSFVYSQDLTSDQNIEQDHIDTVHEGGTLFMACPEYIRTLDPQKAVLASEKWVIEQIYDGLLEYDPNDRIIPVLAEDYPKKLGEYEYLVRLRPGIKFSDGTELDSNDVVFTIKRILNPATQCPTRELFQDL